MRMIWPLIWLRTVTVASEVTVPSALLVTLMSPLCTSAAVTGGVWPRGNQRRHERGGGGGRTGLHAFRRRPAAAERLVELDDRLQPRQADLGEGVLGGEQRLLRLGQRDHVEHALLQPLAGDVECG